MTLFQDTGGVPRAASAKLADVLSWYGALGDAASGNPPGFRLRKASLALALCEVANASESDSRATYFAGVLHAIGAIGNAAYVKNSDLSERASRTRRWDGPAEGARIAATIAPLPQGTADLIRWQSECWDGTGFPDQLRWHGIPQHAQFLALADWYVRAADPEEALGAIGMQSGRAFGPEWARVFVTWFHTAGGEIANDNVSSDALDVRDDFSEGALLDDIADRVDAHNGVAGRWRRVERFAVATAQAIALDAADVAQIRIAARIYGAGELQAPSVEDSQFDPLARLGIDGRAKHAAAAAALARDIASFAGAAGAVAARAEWYDGTGKPAGLMHRAIPVGARVLSAAIASDKLDRQERLDTAVGTQFDPRVVQALLDSSRTRP